MLDGGLEAGDLRRTGYLYKREGEKKTSLPGKDAEGYSIPKSFRDFEQLDEDINQERKERIRYVDVTFVTPMPWVKADIEEFTGQEAELL
jgi:hypothetical protein